MGVLASAIGGGSDDVSAGPRSLQGCGSGTCVPSSGIERGGTHYCSERTLTSQATCEAAGNTWRQSTFANWVRHHDIVYLSGNIARGENITVQAAGILAKLDASLEEAGTDKSNILTAQVYLADIDNDFGGFNEVWSGWLAPGAAPVRAAVQARMCCTAGFLAEVMITAAMP